ncbi:hypothetical protein B484DRAFT_43248 [Ochromonadaceae sp. CCMP2298]|nr:hypothetical protein B484DRAFT_43248 [Ochromonadaceae sp. CCMP2298]
MISNWIASEREHYSALLSELLPEELLSRLDHQVLHEGHQGDGEECHAVLQDERREAPVAERETRRLQLPLLACQVDPLTSGVFHIQRGERHTQRPEYRLCGGDGQHARQAFARHLVERTRLLALYLIYLLVVFLRHARLCAGPWAPALCGLQLCPPARSLHAPCRTHGCPECRRLRERDDRKDE